jgi:hypothetical protein
MTSPGEEKAWDILKNADPAVVCRNAGVTFDEQHGAFVLRSFCTDYYINSAEKTVRSPLPSGRSIIEKYAYFVNHSFLWYLIYAKDIPLTGKLVRPADIKGGEMFFRGSHVIPLDGLSKKYGGDKDAFRDKGRDLCAEELGFGDSSLKLFPLPRTPVTLILWLADKEFPSRADLLLDSSCEMQLPIDIIWSTAMMSVLAML